jgi:hypothetical protein
MTLRPRHLFYQETVGDFVNGHRDRITYIQRPEHLRAFVIDQKFDQFNFMRSPTYILRDLMIERLQQLRKRYDYLRLWFSGGKDSRVIFDLSVEQGIHFDEIVIIDHRPAGDFVVGVQREIKLLATDYLAMFDLPHTKVSLIKLEAPHYNSVFRNPEWIHHYLYHNIHAPMHPPLFFQYVNPEFELLEKKEGMGEVCGSVHPLIRQDQEGNLGFFFVDQQFAMENCDNDVENFLCSGDMPELVLTYVRDLVQTYYDSQTSVPTLITNDRHIRDRLPIYGNIELPSQHASLPKLYDGSWYPDSHELWRSNRNLKQWLHCLACSATNQPNIAWQNYVNLTDWAQVKISNDYPGIITQTYFI